MASDDHATAGARPLPLKISGGMLGAGLALTALALIWFRIFESVATPLRVFLIVAGVIVAGGGVSLRLLTAGLALKDRLISAGFVLIAALVAFVGSLAMDPVWVHGQAARNNLARFPDWDSARLLLHVLAAVALGGAGLIALPSLGRRIAVSVLIVIHFGGILIAVTSVPPPGAAPPWVVSQAWTYFYRYYLQFMYLNNAYHFYSPEPGPPTLLWFRIEYADGSTRWIKVPNREEFGTRLAYQRKLALTESANNIIAQPPPNIDWRAQQRLAAGRDYVPQVPDYYPRIDPPAPGEPTPPEKYLLPPDIYTVPRYREPQLMSKFYIESYARHVAKFYPSESNPDLEVKAIKIYRLVHLIPSAGWYQMGTDPLNPKWYLAYYQGEYNKEGDLINANDPFLYFLLPIYWDKKPNPKEGSNRPEYELVDSLMNHANGKPRQGGAVGP